MWPVKWVCREFHRQEDQAVLTEFLARFKDASVAKKGLVLDTFGSQIISSTCPSRMTDS
jgi:hypothetical protein